MAQLTGTVLSNMSNSLSYRLNEKIVTCIQEGRRHNTSHYKGARTTTS